MCQAMALLLDVHATPVSASTLVITWVTVWRLVQEMKTTSTSPSLTPV